MSGDYPAVLHLEGRRVTVVGCGKVGARKVRRLIASGAHVTVISPTLSELVEQSTVTWVARPYKTGDLQGAQLVFACTNDHAVNAQVSVDAAGSQWVNNTSDPTQSNFSDAAIIESGDAIIAISTRSHTPGKARAIKRRIRALLDSAEDRLR